VLPGLARADHQRAHRLLARVRLAALTGPESDAEAFTEGTKAGPDRTEKPKCPLREYL
jgi:hypothetical protein